MRSNSSRRRNYRPVRKLATLAHVLRGIVLEAMGAAVLVFLFLATRLTPEQLEQFGWSGLRAADPSITEPAADSTPTPGPLHPRWDPQLGGFRVEGPPSPLTPPTGSPLVPVATAPSAESPSAHPVHHWVGSGSWRPSRATWTWAPRADHQR